MVVSESYPIILYGTLLVLLAVYGLALIPCSTDHLLKRSNEGGMYSTIILSLSIILFFGLRPVDPFFVDTMTYARMYQSIQDGSPIQALMRVDFGFRSLMFLLAKVGLSVQTFFLLVSLVYVGAITYVIYGVFRKNSFIVLLAFASTFFFYSSGVNVIRNGMACAIVFCGIYLHSQGRTALSLLLFFLALTTHISTILIVTAYIGSCYLYSNTKAFMLFWLVCLLLSIVLGRDVELILIKVGLVGDWRDTSYWSGVNVDRGMFSRSGYRWDFLLYSLPPIVWGGYWVLVRKMKDHFYRNVVNVYLFGNAIWLLINQSWVSDRIAALSWFFQVLILLYPLLKFSGNIDARKPLIIAMTMFNLLFSIFIKVL